MQSGINRLSMIWVFVTGVVLTAAMWAAHRSINLQLVSTQWVTHTHNVTVGLERVLALLTDAETGQRGYLLTGRREYLEHPIWWRYSSTPCS